MEVYTQQDFHTYRRNYSLMLEILFSNPLISDFFNNVANPSQLDGYSGLMLDALAPYNALLIYNLVSQIESEFIFVKQQNEPFIFLRERSRLAARLTGDYIAQKMQPLLRPFLQQQVEAIDEDMTVQEVSELFLQIFFSAQFIRAMPLEICFLIKQVIYLAEIYGFENYSYMLSGNLLFLRCFCPAMSAPDYFKISDRPLSAKQRTILIKASKILNYIPNSIQEGFYLDDGLEDDADFIFGHQEEYIDFVNRLLRKDFSRLERNLVYHTKQIARGPSRSERSSFSFSATENTTPSEFIESYLKCQKDEKIEVDSSKYSLRTLGCIHATIIDQKEKIYDIVQSIYDYTGDYHAEFEIEIHRQRFERLLKTYADFYHLEDTKLYGTMALLQQLLAKCPPLVEVVERKRPASWACNLKTSQMFLKFSHRQIFVLRNDPSRHDYGEQGEASPSTVIYCRIPSASVVYIKILDKQTAIELSYKKESALAKDVFIFADDKTRKEAAAELVETCYMQSSRRDELRGNKLVILFKDSFSEFDASSDACVRNYHFSKVKSVQAILNNLIVELSDDYKLFYQFEQPGNCQDFQEIMQQCGYDVQGRKAQ